MTTAALARHLRNWSQRFTRSSASTITLTHRFIYVLPTRTGLVFAFMLLVMWLGAVNYGNSMMFAFTFLLAGTAVVSILHTFRNLRGLRVSPLPPEPVFAGEPAIFPLRLENPSGLARPAVRLRLNRKTINAADIPPHCRVQLHLQQPATGRGWLQAPRFRLFTTFPLGLFRAWSWLDFSQRCLVYPAPEAGAVPMPPGTAVDGSGRHGDSGMDDFRELRRYRPGDSPRHVAWRLVARGQEPQTKQFGGQALAPIWLDWFMLEGMDAEARLARLCRWVLDAEAEQRPYGLRLPHTEVAISRGSEHRARCLAALALCPC